MLIYLATYSIVKIKLILAKLQNMNCHVKIVWIKAHAGVIFIEKVESLAKEGDSPINHMSEQENYLCVTKSSLRAKWEHVWNQQHIHLKTHECCNFVSIISSEFAEVFIELQFQSFFFLFVF